MTSGTTRIKKIINIIIIIKIKEEETLYEAFPRFNKRHVYSFFEFLLPEAIWFLCLLNSLGKVGGEFLFINATVNKHVIK